MIIGAKQLSFFDKLINGDALKFSQFVFEVVDKVDNFVGLEHSKILEWKALGKWLVFASFATAS